MCRRLQGCVASSPGPTVCVSEHSPAATTPTRPSWAPVNFGHQEGRRALPPPPPRASKTIASCHSQEPPVGGGQSLTIFNGCCLAGLLEVEHRKHLQNLLLLHSLFQKALLDHRRQIRRGQFLESSPRCSRLAQNVPLCITTAAPASPLPILSIPTVALCRPGIPD